MLKNEVLLSHEELLELLDYEPSTGVFLWKKKIADKIAVGSMAGSHRSGYRVIRIYGTIYRAHRLAWFYVHKKWPVADIDHRNLIRDDNRIENLREATRSQNLTNVKVRRCNSSGIKGVSKNGRGFMARLTKGGKFIYIGTFSTPEEAHAAYVAASQLHHGEYGRSA